MRKTTVFLSLLVQGYFILTGSVIFCQNFPKKNEKEGTLTQTKNLGTPAKRQSLPSKNILKPQPLIYKYNEPWDLVELIPVVRDINRMIPRRFSLADHQFILSSNEMVIKHHFHDPKIRAAGPKNSIITFSYSGDFETNFGTRLDIPLFYSSVFGFSDWSSYPLGNYTMTFTRTGFSPQETLYLKAVTRF